MEVFHNEREDTPVYVLPRPHQFDFGEGFLVNVSPVVGDASFCLTMYTPAGSHRAIVQNYDIEEFASTLTSMVGKLRESIAYFRKQVERGSDK